ncbi:hypothetical protein Tco_1302534 [Tanacetum coccineum]
MRQGWDPRYKIWVEHGEPAPPTPPPVIDNTRQPLMSDMTALLNDLSYIPPNNEHNEPTQGDIGETSNEPTQATRNEFEELYASANEELYPGCDYVTRLDFMAKFTYFKAKGRLTDSIFNEMLEFFQNVFPISKGFKLPPSYYAIKKTFKTIGLGYESIHACEHDCCLFRGDNNKDLDFCPVCNTSRWKDSNTPGKKVPKKVLRYFPIIPRLQRLYKSSHTAKDMIWHATGKCTSRLAADGFQSVCNLSQATAFGRLLIEDLKVLWTERCRDYRLLLQARISIERAMVLWTINDFPARSSLSGEWARHRQGKTRLANVGHSKWLVARPNQKREVLEASGCIRQRHVDNDQDPEVSTTNELFALANGPSWTPISVNSCVVDGVRYVVHSRDERRTTQNSGICSPGPDGEMYYGQLQEIIEFKYLLFKVALFRVKWFDTSNKGRKVNKLVLRNNMTQIDCSREAFKDDQYILVTQVKQVFYLEDKTKPHWKVVEHVNHKKFSDGGVIVVEDDPDIIHFEAKHWKQTPPQGTYDVEGDFRQGLPGDYSGYWDSHSGGKAYGLSIRNSTLSIIDTPSGDTQLVDGSRYIPLRMIDSRAYIEDDDKLEGKSVYTEDLSSDAVGYEASMSAPLLPASLKSMHRKVGLYDESFSEATTSSPRNICLRRPLHDDFLNSPDIFSMDDLESDNKSVDAPPVSPFIDSDDELDDGEVLNELNVYGNAGNLYNNMIINDKNGCDLAFSCMIGFTKFVAYFDPFLPMNVITRKAYNTIVVDGLESTRKNLVAIVRNIYCLLEVLLMLRIS